MHAPLASAIEVRRVPIAELGGDIPTLQGRLRAIQPYAIANGFVGGYPSYIDDPDGQSISVVLLKPKAAKLLEVRAEALR